MNSRSYTGVDLVGIFCKVPVVSCVVSATLRRNDGAVNYITHPSPSASSLAFVGTPLASQPAIS